MAAGERELYERFADYDEEELLRILTVERGKYRDEALEAARKVLLRRGVHTPPALRPPPEPVVSRPGTKSPYQPIDFLVDVLLAALACWALQKLWVWTQSPRHPPQSDMAFFALAAGFLWSAISLRRKWRAKQWRD